MLVTETGAIVNAAVVRIVDVITVDVLYKNAKLVLIVLY